MPLKVVPGRLDIQAEGIRFCLGDGVILVSCFVARFMLQDLAGHHLPGTKVTDLQSFSELLPEIEHLANAKYVSGRTEANGEIKLGTADLLRHGVQNPGAHLEQAHLAIINFGGDANPAETMNSQSRNGHVSETREARLHESLPAPGKVPPRRKADGALFREGLHLRTALRAGSLQNSSDFFEPVTGMVVELSDALSQKCRPVKE